MDEVGEIMIGTCKVLYWHNIEGSSKNNSSITKPVARPVFQGWQNFT